MSFDARHLYELLPVLYRLRDAGHARTPRPNDAGFFDGDGRERCAQRVDVVESHRHDRGDERFRGVRRVETSAETDLQNRGVDRVLPKRPERGRGHHLEKRRMGGKRSFGESALARCAHDRQRVVKRALGDVLTLDPDAFVRAHEMR